MLPAMPKLTGYGTASNTVTPTDFCPGCGYYLAVTGRHRGDCSKPDGKDGR